MRDAWVGLAIALALGGCEQQIRECGGGIEVAITLADGGALHVGAAGHPALDDFTPR